MKIKVVTLSLLISILSVIFVYGDDCFLNTNNDSLNNSKSYNCSITQNLAYSNTKHTICHTVCGQSFVKYLIDYTNNCIRNKQFHNNIFSDTNFLNFNNCLKNTCVFDLSCLNSSKKQTNQNNYFALNKTNIKTYNKTNSSTKQISTNKNNKNQIVKKPISKKPKTQKKPEPPKNVTPKTPAKPVKPKTPQTPTKPTKPTTPTKPVEKPISNPTSLSYEKKVVQLVNLERAKNGLNKLTLSSALSNSARAKSQDMINNSYFSHTSPTYGSVGNMLNKFGISYNAYGENIAYGQRTPEQVVKAWMESPGHRANILSSHFSKIGVGYVTSSNGTPYWTQQFTN